MTTQEIYKKLLSDLNKDDTNDGIFILLSSFVSTFNAERIRWLGERLKEDSDNVNLNGLDDVFEPDVLLNKVKDYEDSVEFQLPVDFYRHASSYCKADKGECKGVKIFTFEKKPLGFNTTLSDDFAGPQFDYQETPFIITKNKMKVYFDDFKIKSQYVSYYKLPKAIDIEGYEHFDGSPSTNIDTDLIDEHVDEIITRMVVKFTARYKDMEGFQLAKERTVSEP